MEIISTLRTTGAVRAFTDEPVADAVVHEILDDARFAPSGGNRQPWRVAVVEDPTIRRRLGDLMQPVWDGYVARPRSASRRTTVVDDREPTSRRRTLRTPCSTRSHRSPSCSPSPPICAGSRRWTATLERPPLTGGASIYPFCWSILLAARAAGLGGVMTTFLSRAEPAAAPALGLPDASRARGDDLPRRPRAPAHQAAAAAGRGVHHRRPLRRPAVRPVLRSPDGAEERPHLVDEDAGLLERGEVSTAVELVPVADVDEPALRPAARRRGRSPCGKIDIPDGTSTGSRRRPRKLSQYSRADDAPAPGSQ